MSDIKLDARTKYRLDRAIYLMQEALNMELPPKIRWDLMCFAFDITEPWKHLYEDLEKERIPLKWYEMKLWLKRDKPEGWETILKAMKALDEGGTVRNGVK